MHVIKSNVFYYVLYSSESQYRVKEIWNFRAMRANGIPPPAYIHSWSQFVFIKLDEQQVNGLVFLNELLHFGSITINFFRVQYSVI